MPFTWQIGDPNVLAEMTGVSVVADFRRRDVAAGGQGAPLLPVFHDQVFRSDEEDRVIANLGGIANITILTQGSSVTGFDTGPANRLLDAWIAEHQGKEFDAGGAWAASGQVDETLLNELLDEPYLRLAPPKSTGRELFNLSWLKSRLGLFSRRPGRCSGDTAAVHGAHARRRGAPIRAGRRTLCLRRRGAQFRIAQRRRRVDCAQPRRQHSRAWAGSRLCRSGRLRVVREAHSRGADFERRQRYRRAGRTHFGRRVSLRLREHMNDTDLQVPQLYFNRELSFLEFNQRVLDQAKDPSIPILERVRFLCISCAILDEFFEIRVASLKELLEAGAIQGGPDGLSVPEQLKAIRVNAVRLVDEQYEVLNDVLMPELAKNGIIFVEPETWTPAQAAWIKDYFTREVEPVLSPLALDPARPFPKILNKSLNFAIVVEGEDGFGRNSGLAVVQAPRSLPRLIRLPDELGSRNFVFLGTIVEAFVSTLFAGMQMRGCYQFRVTRNSDLFVEQEEVDDLLRAVEGELASRRYGDAVRLETAHDCPEEILAYLLEQFALTRTICTRSPGR